MTLHREIFRNTILVTLIGIVGQVLGFVLTLAIAREFGATGITDAYYVAVVVPVMLAGLLGGAVKLVFVPVFVEERIRDPEGAHEVVQSVLFLLLTLSFLIVVPVAMLVASGALDFGAQPETRRLARRLILELLPLVPLILVTKVFNAVYNAYQRFALAEVERAVVFLVTIASLFLLSPSIGIHSLVLGQLAGQLVALGILYAVIKRNLGLPLLPRPGLPPGVKRMLKLASVGIASYVMAMVNPLIGRVIASYLPEGSVSFLSYAEKLATIPAVVIGSGFTGVLVSYWSKMSAEGDEVLMRESLNRGISMMLMVLVPLVAGLILLRDPLVSVVYERGAFAAEDARRTADVFAFLALGVVPTYLNMMLIRIFLAEKAIGYLLSISSLGFVLNVGLMLAFVSLTGRVEAVAAAVSLSVAIVVVVESFLVHRRFVPLSLTYLGHSVARILVGTAIMIAVVLGVDALVTVAESWDDLVTIAASGLVGAVTYGLLMWRFGHPDAYAVGRLLLAKLSGGRQRAGKLFDSDSARKT